MKKIFNASLEPQEPEAKGLKHRRTTLDIKGWRALAWKWKKHNSHQGVNANNNEETSAWRGVLFLLHASCKTSWFSLRHMLCVCILFDLTKQNFSFSCTRLHTTSIAQYSSNEYNLVWNNF